MTSPSVGIDAKYFAKIESAFDTIATFAATDAVPLLDLKFTPKQDYHRSMEHLGTAGLVNEIKSMSGGTWSATAYVKPNAAGVAPDVGPFLKAAFGTETIVADTSVTYAFNSSDPSTIQLGRFLGTSFGEWVTGAWIEELTIEVQGGQEPKISVSGGFATIGWAFTATAGDVLISATTLTLASSSASRVGVNARIKIGTDDNAGAGYLVTAYNPSTRVVTFSPALGSGQTAPTIVPFYPSQTLSGFIVGGISCGLSLDGGSTAIGMISGKTVVKTGYKPKDKEATASKPTGVYRGLREINVEVQAYFLPTENGTWVGHALDGLVSGNVAGDANMVMRVGENTAAQRMKVNAPKARVEVSPLDIPESDAVTTAIKLVPRQNSAADDQMTLVFD